MRFDLDQRPKIPYDPLDPNRMGQGDEIHDRISSYYGAKLVSLRGRKKDLILTLDKHGVIYEVILGGAAKAKVVVKSVAMICQECGEPHSYEEDRGRHGIINACPECGKGGRCPACFSSKCMEDEE